MRLDNGGNLRIANATQANSLGLGNSINFGWTFAVDGAGTRVETFANGFSNEFITSLGVRDWTGPSGSLMTLDQTGNMVLSGQANVNALGINPQNAYEWQFSATPAGDKIQQFRASPLAFNQWRSADGARLWVSENGPIMTLDDVGNLSAMTGVYMGPVANGFGLIQDVTGSRYLSWAPNWADIWQTNGTRVWNGPSGALMTLAPNGDLTVTGGISLAGGAISLNSGGVTITGNLVVNGSVNVSGNLAVAGTVTSGSGTA